MKTIVIIPARMASERLPGKPLMKMKGESIIYLCYYTALLSTVDKVFVASSDPEILWEVCKGGGNPIETSDLPVNGTERVAEAARTLQLAPDDIVVNLQGDMPFFDPEIINKPINKMKAIPECNIASAMTLLKKEDKSNPNRVKVIVDGQGRAIDFSRERGDFLHIGVYVFRNSFLQKYAEYGITDIEVEMRLEQKRIDFMNDYIWMSFVESCPVVIDAKEDLINAQK
jgi:3-deoxy-manno-octulosonate cytidylyltransferase (CMP-KDO synthetase)